MKSLHPPENEIVPHSLKSKHVPGEVGPIDMGSACLAPRAAGHPTNGSSVGCFLYAM